MKRKESALRLGFTFAGCYLGAGYVSGQELWQFFGCFGWQGIAGLLLAVDTIPDVFATTGNVTGNLTATTIVAHYSPEATDPPEAG